MTYGPSNSTLVRPTKAAHLRDDSSVGERLIWAGFAIAGVTLAMAGLWAFYRLVESAVTSVLLPIPALLTPIMVTGIAVGLTLAGIGSALLRGDGKRPSATATTGPDEEPRLAA